MKKRMLICKRIIFSLLFLFAITNLSWSQVVTGDSVKVTGKVIDETGAPMPYVNILVKGTQKGTTTDEDGNYSLEVPKGETIVFYYIGYASLERVVTEDGDVSVSMQPESDQLSEVVITALGIKREKRAIGYAVDQIDSETLNSVGEPNAILNLSGKTPGVQISASPNGMVDGSPRVVIRGVTSLSSDNQPLYVLDGLPLLSNRSLSEGVTADGSGNGIDLGNPLSDINPNDIESISVLKGASATALYGARGANGVIMITTKKGKSGQKGWGVTLSSSTTFQSALLLPKSQLEYGQGIDGQYEYIDGQNGTNENRLELWGPRYDGQQISQWDPTTGGAISKPWLAYGANNVENFFETGHVHQQNVSLTNVTESSNMRFSIGHQNVKGIVPNTGLKRITGSMNSTFQLGKKLSLTFVGSGSRMTSGNRVSAGLNSPLADIYLGIPTNIDIRDLRDYKNAVGNKNSFFRNGPNPYWDLYENRNPVERNRFSTNIGLAYAVNDWLSLQANLFQDSNVTDFQRITAKYEFSLGGYSEGLLKDNEINAEFRLNINKDITKDLNLNFMAGAAKRDEKRISKSAQAVGGLSVAGIYNLGNSSGQPTVSNSVTEKQVQSVFGSLELSYKNYAFLTVTGRNDWSSTLPKEAWSFFYPSVSGSFIFTDAFGLKNDIFNYGKLRASWAQVGNDTSPYSLSRFVLRDANSFNGQPLLRPEDIIPASQLIPEESTSFEIGGEFYFLKSKIKLDLAYYKNESSNQLISINSAWERGAPFSFINSGTITNKGVEVKLDINPIKTENFRWDISMNYSKNKGTVSDFPIELTDFKTIGAWQGPEVRATNGLPYGHITGFEYFYDSQDSYDRLTMFQQDFSNFGYTPENNLYGTGKILTRNGFPMSNTFRGGTADLGVIAPLDWTGGIYNTFRYKKFSLNFLVDIKYGGNVISTTASQAIDSGILPNTVGLNSNGVDIREDIANGGGIIFEGIDVETGQPNTIAIDPQELYFAQDLLPTGEIMRHATNIKLRELSIGYSLDKKLVNKFGLSDVKVALTGRNLWIIKNDLDDLIGIDSEIANLGSLNNGTGFESGSLPSTRSLGFNINLSF